MKRPSRDTQSLGTRATRRALETGDLGSSGIWPKVTQSDRKGAGDPEINLR